jgi:uncharacterized protein YqjF (DUF2071 family)
VSHHFNAGILDVVAHRPWAMPQSPWVMTQTWHDLLFAHWPVNTEVLRARVPPQFSLDLFAGVAWLGIVPFHMTNVAPRGIPTLPWVSAFAELNVRTYVRVDDRPGVYFLSLDAGRALAVHAARMLLNLPYCAASMYVRATADGVDYRSQRAHPAPAAFAATYGPTGPPFVAPAGSLDYFLTERYCLYNLDHRGRPYRMDIHHPPWPLQPARARFTRNTMAASHGVVLPDRPALLHFAKRQDTVAWAPARIR